MGPKVLFPIAVGVFLAATMGADVIPRTSIAGEPLAVALREHLHYASMQLVRTILLLAPFVAVAFICSRAQKQARSRSISVVFGVAMGALLYFYYEGHQEAQQALLEERWTAAALSIGMLPLFIGVPVVVGTWVAAALAKRFDRRMSE